MRKTSILIGMCLILAVALNVWAYQRSHPEIMQSVLSTRDAVTASLEAGNGAQAATQAMELQGLFQELVPIYERMNLAPASVELANKAAGIAGATAKAAKANDLDAANASHSSIGKSCGGCHGQFREKADDGSYRIKTGG